MTGDHETILKLDRLAIGYGGVPLVPPLTAEVHRAETFFVVGPNGAGKSTLVKTMLGLLAPVSGSVGWTRKGGVSYVRQRHGMDLTVRQRVCDVVAAGADTGLSFLKPLYLRRQHRAIEEAMAECDVTSLMRAQMSELSEGQRQRVLMARALASEPEVLVLDEPTSAMDTVNEHAIFDLMLQLQRTRGLTLILITHRLEELATVAHCGIMVDREHGVALYGSLRDVWQSEAFRVRYGPLELPTPGGPA